MYRIQFDRTKLIAAVIFAARLRTERPHSHRTRLKQEADIAFSHAESLLCNQRRQLPRKLMFSAADTQIVLRLDSCRLRSEPFSSSAARGFTASSCDLMRCHSTAARCTGNNEPLTESCAYSDSGHHEHRCRIDFVAAREDSSYARLDIGSI